MVQSAIIIRGLIASPSDVEEERQAAQEVIAAWNARNSWDRGITIEPVMWESHSVPLNSDRPQGLLNSQLVGKCDFVIGIFWRRIGSETGVSESGTIEEIDQFDAKGQPSLLYFSTKALPQNLDQGQWDKLKAFKEKRKGQRLYQDYATIYEFRESLRGHLDEVVKQVMQKVPAYQRTPTVGRAPNELRNQLKRLVEEYSLDFDTEKAVEAPSTDDGKRILERLGKKLFELSLSEHPSLTPEVKEELRICIVNTKAMQQHQTYLDGGKSYNEFWLNGEQILKDVDAITAMIDEQ